MSEQSSGEGAAPSGGVGRLTEQEQKLVAKLLSDPTFFPIEFRTWLKQFMEGADIRITAGQIVSGGGSGTNVATGLPAGIILPFGGGPVIPADSLRCDGAAIVRADYMALFQAIGVTWGAGDGTITFNLPDLRDRALYGAGSKVALGETDGAGYGSRGGPQHHHNFNQTSGGGGSHAHGFSGSTGSVGDHSHYGTAPGNGIMMSNYASVALGSGGSGRYIANALAEQTAGAGGHNHGFSGSTDTHNGHNHNVSGDTSGGYAQDRASYAGVQYVITTGG